MNIEDLRQKTLEIATLLSTSKERFISRVEYQNHLQGEFEEYSDLIREALLSNEKIKKNIGRTGGLRFELQKGQRAKFGNGESKMLEKVVDKLWAKYNEDIAKIPRQRPEKEVELAFKDWLENQQDFFSDRVILNFRSDAKRAGSLKNVDGYLIQIEKGKYRVNFSPILITFEVKADIPQRGGIIQARSYMEFSHHVYLVFKSNLDSEALKIELTKSGYTTQENIGIFFTRDGVNFTQLYPSKATAATWEKVEEHIDILLSDSDKERLHDEKYKYLLSELFIPAISLDV